MQAIRSINLTIKKDQSVQVPADEVWKVTLHNGKIGTREYRGSIIETNVLLGGGARYQ